MRKTILPYAVWLAILIALVLLFHPKGVLAESFSMTDQEGNTVRLLDEPCYSAPPWMGWRKAFLHWHGNDYEACWRVFNRTVLILDSAGDATPVPIVAFKKDEAI